MYKVGRVWKGKYIFYCGHASFSLWTESEFSASTMTYAVAVQLAGAYDANVIQIY